MEPKTKVSAPEGLQEILITRTFNLPVELLYKAHTIPSLIEQWMNNKVLELNNEAFGSYQFENKDEHGNILFLAQGCIHSIVENSQIVRTFQMVNAGFPVQLEFLDFKSTSNNQSKLDIKIIFKSVEDRNNLLKLPFAQGINGAHNRLQKILKPL
ncbi:SRPBCC domain-containing protein [Belliella sp. DSM 111904]|uniref:SRPBCC domain-containing protein n=1 Tax=Belliella filtrata TaxID=2923435 RepID=A0ABS9UZA4_9BACT|nr:SRPBCC domain-containing protein [Belliella filtrata]MCH7409444.1 SRPBCC domain-containing protein [Belliella filtrata]